MPKAYDSQTLGLAHFEVVRGPQHFSQASRKIQRAIDCTAVTGQPVMQQRHPHLQRPEAARLLKAVLGEPRRSADPGQTAVSAQVRRHKAEGSALYLLMPDENEAGFDWDAQPLVRS